MHTPKIPAKVQTEINRQFNQELSAAHGYRALALWCDDQNLRMLNSTPWFLGVCAWILAASLPSAFSAETKPAGVQPLFYRMNQLDDAKKRAVAEGKPIGWIASYPEYLAPHENLMGNGSHAASAYAIRALQKETILVFSDSRTENHQEPSIVDTALHSPDPHYTVPGVIILTPSLDKIICKAPFTSDSQERVRIFTEALKKIRDKDSWREKAPQK